MEQVRGEVRTLIYLQIPNNLTGFLLHANASFQTI